MFNKLLKSILYTGILLYFGTIYASPLPFDSENYTLFESGHVRPMAMSADGSKLFVVNTPDNHLEIFDIKSHGIVHSGSVPVGLEPVAVAVNGNEVWVVNHLSDSVSIIDLSQLKPYVMTTLQVGDEPRDIVFAGVNNNKVFITTAHRGQNSPYTDPTNPGELTTPGIGRADVWVFSSGAGQTGGTSNPLAILTLFGDTPRALTVSPDKSKVYAAIFHSGNKTTTVNEGVVCNGGATANPCVIDSLGNAPGGLPAPNSSFGDPQPEVGLIVKHDGTQWTDELGRDWSSVVRFNLPDTDVFEILADGINNPDIPPEERDPVVINSFSGVGTILYNMAVHPYNGKVYVANTEAMNHVRFEGTRLDNTITSVIGHQHETRISIIDPALAGPLPDNVVSRHLNKHIDYTQVPAFSETRDKSLALPRQLVFSPDGSTLYVAAKGSNKIGIFNTQELEYDSFVPDSANHILVSGGGPSGVLFDEARNRLYVTTRFDNGFSVIDATSKTETHHFQMPNPEPASVIAGRRFLYDAYYTSSNGEAACASCHVDGDFDSLAWDLGDPLGSSINIPGPFVLGLSATLHPMKGPMTTQTLRGMNTHGPMHWRGDRTGGNDEPSAQPDSGTFNEALAFKKFNPAFVGLLGREAMLTDAEMDTFTNFILQLMPPPNPVRNLDDTLTPMQQAGRDTYMNSFTDAGILTCNNCHALDPAQGFFGTDGRYSFDAETQDFKIAQLRNMYAKVGMFGMPAAPFFNPGDNGHKGDQIRGFGFMHDGATDTLLRFLNANLFNFPGGDTQRKEVEQFLLAFDADFKPAVGQQTTIYGAYTTPESELISSQAGYDIVLRGWDGANIRSWVKPSGSFNDSFISDKVSEGSLFLSEIQALNYQKMTYTVLASDIGNIFLHHPAIDRDQDNILDGDDNCPAIANNDQADNDIFDGFPNADWVGDACDNCPLVSNPEQTDNEGDGLGDVCDPDDDNDGLSDILEISIGTSPLVDADTDGDGISDFDEVNYDGNSSAYTPGADLNPLSIDTDGDGYEDSWDIYPVNYNYLDGDIAPPGAPDGVVNAADYAIAIKIVLGEATPTTKQLSHGDVWPINNPDGVITTSDLVRIRNMVLQLGL